MTKFDPSTLFEPWKPGRAKHAYRSPAAELDAVASGAKGMSKFSFPREVLTSRDAEYVEILTLALARDLVVALRRVNDRSVQVYVARAEELWRVPAHHALWETALTGGAWSDAAEMQESFLLGYSAAQRTAWLAEKRDESAAWGAPTVYALLTAAQRKAIEALGKRCFAAEKLQLMHPTGSNLRRNARTLVPAGFTLARVALGREMFDALFGKRQRVDVPVEKIAETNAALRSNVQFLDRGGWK
jgi:hypothetical protein